MLSNPIFQLKSVHQEKLFIIFSFCASLWVTTGYAAPDQPALTADISVTEGMSHLEIQQANGSWQKVGAEKLELPVVVRTQSTGSSKISQGETSITLNPNTELSLAASSSRAKKLISLIKQRIGSAIYKVEKHPGEFRVETPYLVSVVKGTRFSVVTDNRDSLVTVTEGLVEVRDLRSGESNMARPGEIIRSARSNIGDTATQDMTQALSDPNSKAKSSTSLPSPIRISVDKVIDRNFPTEKSDTDTMRDGTIETREVNTFEAVRTDIDFETKAEVKETSYEKNFANINEQRFEANEQKARDTDSFKDLRNNDVTPSKDEFENIDPDNSLDGRDDSTFTNDGTDRSDSGVETVEPEPLDTGTSGGQDASVSPGGQT